MSFFGFHPLIERWFFDRFEAPTEPQTLGWPHIAAGENTLIAAPTGSGKTLTAFLAVIDRLLKESIEGQLAEQGMRVVYVSPLRALSNDMHRNLSVPLEELNALAAEEFPGVPIAQLRVGLRTGDTTSSQRAALVRKPPHILVTTPESLYLLLTAERGREALKTVDTVIVDEIHALVRDKRGSHLALSLERLEEHVGKPLQRIGLSATQKPIERVADFLTGVRPLRPSTREGLCRIVDVGHSRALDLEIVVPPSELSAVCSNEQWAEVSDLIVELINSHRSTLIFVNTRRLAERITHWLSGILGEEHVSSHHGSIASDRRLDTEYRLKNGQLKAVVATASLELGLDVGFIDLVIQAGSPRSIATFLQRIGRSGHSLGKTPKGRLLALTRDELVECMALIRAVRAGRLDNIPIPENPVDVLAQQIVAEVACREWGTDELFDVCRRAWPFRNLKRKAFDETLHFLSEGLTDRAGRARVYLHHDMVQRRVRSRPGARIVATSNAGAIPETGLFRVVTEDGTVVGTLDEDFAIESHSGQIFLLGNTSWRIQHVRGMDVTVTDAGGAPPTIPFWRGEAPGRTLELSEEISNLREELEEKIKAVPETVVATWWDEPRPPGARTETDLDQISRWLVEESSCSEFAAQQVVLYVASQIAAVGLVPTQKRVIFERFFDESGGMQMVVHAPFGSRITHAWGLAMRKRFCRSFDFELQATADDNGFILSLGPQHSFPLESMFTMLNPGNVRGCVEQSLLYIPMFQIRWRWNANRALIVPRRDMGKKIPPNLQRFRADDLLTSVFPLLTGCQENVVGELEVPDHVLVQQTMHDCLTEALDVVGLEEVLGRIDRGEMEFVARDTREPSPFSYQLLNSNPYSFLDGGEIQERRARAVSTRRSLSVESVNDLGRLDPLAIEQVVNEASPLIRNADELHDVLLTRIVVPADELLEYEPLFEELAQQKRATRLQFNPRRTDAHVRPSSPNDVLLGGTDVGVRPTAGSADCGEFAVIVAAERLPAALAMFPDAMLDPLIEAPEGVRTEWNNVEARIATIRGLMEVSGPLTADEVSQRTGMTDGQAFGSLEALEGEGIVLRGRFREKRTSDSSARIREGEAPADDAPAKGESPDSTGRVVVEWCHRRLLARIHRLTMDGLRRQIQPVTPDVFLRFLTEHHGLAKHSQRAGSDGLFEVISILQGIDLAASSWEESILPGRVRGYRPEWLDELCLTGEVGWGRLFPPKKEREAPASLSKIVPVSLFLRSDAEWLTARFDSPSPALRAPSPPEGGEGTDVGETQSVSFAARRVATALDSHGAMFATDLMSQCELARGELNQALGELISLGVVTADGFGGLRDLSGGRKATRSGAVLKPGLVRQRHSAGGTGRWTLTEPGARSAASESAPSSPSGGEGTAMAGCPPAKAGQRTDKSEIVEQWAWQLLRRWGVVFRDLLIRESGAPRWWELLQVYRRLEARGEIRGGRFISGVAGEQFGLGETVRRLRHLRDEASRPTTRTRTLRHSFLDAMRSGEPQAEESSTSEETSNRDGLVRVVALPGGVVEERSAVVSERSESKPGGRKPELLILSAADPLNLIGIVTSHARVPSVAHNRIVLLDGRPVAAIQNGELVMLDELPPLQLRELQRLAGCDFSAEILPPVTGQGLEPESPQDEPDESGPDPDSSPPRGRRRFRPVIT
ncbi:MAG: DEAD/DEAH box helicase [Planctomycetota bacterium]|nr:DEAD/DEAH box helicase [Planctomycetota bacterium]MDA1250907.1 DEAD/DEAH box helicase [Planctomycetota bacterium]